MQLKYYWFFSVIIYTELMYANIFLYLRFSENFKVKIWKMIFNILSLNINTIKNVLLSFLRYGISQITVCNSHLSFNDYFLICLPERGNGCYSCCLIKKTKVILPIVMVNKKVQNLEASLWIFTICIILMNLCIRIILSWLKLLLKIDIIPTEMLEFWNNWNSLLYNRWKL